MVLRLLCGLFFFDLDTILKGFLGSVRYTNLATSKSSASKEILKKQSVFKGFCKGDTSLWKLDEINERYFLSSENGFLLQSFIRLVFDVILDACGTSFGPSKPVPTLIRKGGQKIIKVVTPRGCLGELRPI